MSSNRPRRSSERGGAAGPIQKTLEAVIEELPELAMAHYQLGLVLASTDKDAAKARLQHFLDLAPDHADAPSARSMIEGL